MKVATQAKLKLAKMMGLKLASVETDKQTLHYDGDTIDEGTEVFVVNADGEYVLPEDGIYVGADGFIYEVEAGVVTSRKPKDAEEELSDEDKEKAKEKLEDEAPDPEDVPDPEAGETVSVEKFNELLQVTKDLAGAVVSIEEKVDDSMGELQEKLRAALKMSKADFYKGAPAGNGTSKSKLTYDAGDDAIFFGAGKTDE